jgi:flavin-dependent dehydrogenase
LLLRRSGATVVEERPVRQIRRDRHDWWVVDEAARARSLVGAGGTHCPVARALGAPRQDPVVVTQELEFEAPARDAAAQQLGHDGEPELLLHDDLGGYAWIVRKTDWVNVGCGTLAPATLRLKWHHARELFERLGHLPPLPTGALGKIRGSAYYRFHPAHASACQRKQAYLVGDALGLAHPVTAEGILPAVLSGQLCAEAVLAGEPEQYQQRLEEHPVFADYRTVHALLEAARVLRPARALGARAGRRQRAVAEPVASVLRTLVAHAFGRSFAGRPWAGGPTIGALLRRAQTLSAGLERRWRTNAAWPAAARER